MPDMSKKVDGYGLAKIRDWAKKKFLSQSVAEKKKTARTTITLSPTGWSGSGPYTQVVSLTGANITANSKIDLQPTPAVLAQLMEDDVTGLVPTNDNGTVTITALGAAPTTALSIQATITETKSALSSIAVTSQATKRNYTAGEALDLSGLVVTATYVDNTTADVTEGCTFSPENGATLSTVGTQTVNVTYNESGVSAATSFNVTVGAAA